MSTDPTIETRGVAEFSRQIERYGFFLRTQYNHDQGIDAQIETIENGKGIGRIIGIQIKTGPSYFTESTNEYFIFRFEERHKNLWKNHSLPIIICLINLETEEIFWERISDSTIQSTGKDYKIHVPQHQVLNSSTSKNIKSLATPIIAPSKYTLYGPSDRSHAGAKRYSADIVLESIGRHWDKVEVAAVIRQETRKLKEDIYYRDEIVQSQFGAKNADVVWISIYLRKIDIGTTDWYCQSQWIDSKLTKNFRPVEYSGESAGDGITIQWNKVPGQLAKMLEEHIQPKHTYLPQIKASYKRLSSTIKPLCELVDKLRRGSLTEFDFNHRTLPLTTLITKEENAHNQRGLAPNDCRELANHFSALRCSLSNIKIVWDGRKDRQLVSTTYLLEQQLNMAKEALPLCEYAIRKSS